jgi:DNA-directed RNA polymerase specialized sigma24 family protein
MDAVLERISASQFIASLPPPELACVFALMLGYSQAEMAVIFGDSPATVCRSIRRVHEKYQQWNS